MTMFVGPKLKIEWANRHIKQLDDALRAFVKTDFYSLRVEIDPQDGLNRLILECTKQVPDQIALMIGDAAHNIRAALDLLACDIVSAGGEEPTQFTKFVFRKTRDELVAALNGGVLKAARAGIVDLIVDTIQPYPGGNGAALYTLHDLDIQDKHLRITPLITLASLRGVDAIDSNGNTYTDTTLTVGAGGKLSGIKTSAKLEITRQGQAAFAVLFKQGQPFEGKPVVPTLHHLSQLVSAVIEKVEEVYLPSN